MWGDKIFFSHGSNRSAGVAICLNRFPGDVITYKTDTEGHWLIAVMKVDSSFLILVSVYGYNSVARNRQLVRNVTENIAELKALHPTNFILLNLLNL